MQSKSVIIFIVEGITDRISLEHIIKNLNNNEKIYFQVVTYDITADLDSNSSNILNKINEQVSKTMREQYFKKKDILKIVHLVDLDGAFIKEESIEYKEIDKTEYSENSIYTKNIDRIKERNLKKSTILNKLSRTQEINSKPYEIYFFSTNLEHVLHNKLNVENSEKQSLAEEFEDKFYNKPEEFIQFINDKAYALQDEYAKTWQFIKESNNSLKRFTNFNLFVNNLNN